MKKVLLIVLLLCFDLNAQNIPQLVNYQGMLTDSQGKVFPTGEYEMSFSVYSDKTGGISVWGPHVFNGINKITVSKGLFNVVLGPVDSGNRNIDEAFKYPNAYLEISVNGQTILPRQQVLSSAYTFQTQVAQYTVEGISPVGSVITWMTETPPEGFLECDGRALSKDDYPELFTVIGYKYGGAESTFYLPDLRGQFLRGWDHNNEKNIDPDKDSRKDKEGNVVGNLLGTFQDDVFKEHNHLTPQTLNNGRDGLGNGNINTPSAHTLVHTSSLTRPSEEKGGNETRPMNISVMYCIKYKKYNE